MCPLRDQERSLYRSGDPITLGHQRKEGIWMKLLGEKRAGVPLFITSVLCLAIGWDFIRFWIKEGNPDVLLGVLFGGSVLLFGASLLVGRSHRSENTRR